MSQKEYLNVNLVKKDFDETSEEFSALVPCEDFQNVLAKFLVAEANKEIEKVW